MSIPLKRYSVFFARYARPLRRQLALLLFLILLSIGLQLINPLIIRYFIDTATAGIATRAETTKLMWAALTFLVGALFLQGVSVVATYVGENIGWRATNQLRSDLALQDLIRRTGVEIDYRFKLDSIDLWETVVMTNTKSALNAEQRQMLAA